VDDIERAELWASMMAEPGDTAEFEVTREVHSPGRSFSADAMAKLDASMLAWVGSRIMRRWETTTEPPTVVRVTITVAVA
jgi:hypothetical protein